jgi:hypothetical protein
MRSVRPIGFTELRDHFPFFSHKDPKMREMAQKIIATACTLGKV